MINILISVDSNYLDKAQTMLYSTRMHTQRAITVYLMNHGLSKHEVDSFSAYLHSKCNMKLVEIDVHSTILDTLPTVDRFSIEMYYRILAQFYLPEELDRVLWLDSDIVVLNDISTLYDQDFEGESYVVCVDSLLNSEHLQQHIKNLGLPNGYRYFNSGVLLINLTLLRHGMCAEEILNYSKTIESLLQYPDQDILNCIYHDKIKYINSKRFNYQLNTIKRIPQEDIKDIIILHYSGSRKPWNYWQINSASKYYWKIRHTQGDWKLVLKNYLLKFWDITYLYFHEISDILF